MSMGISGIRGSEGAVRLDGDKELMNLLRELPGRVQKKGARAAVTAGSTPVLRATRAKVARKTRLLKEAIGRKVKTYKSGVAAAIIGARRSVEGFVHDARGTRKQIPAFYFHLVEGGTKPHDERMKSGQVIHHPGSKAQPALLPAWRENKAQAADLAKKKLAEVTEAEARKLGKL